MKITGIEELRARTGKIISPEMILFLMEDPVLSDKKIAHTGIAIWLKDKDWHRSSLDYNGISAALMPGKAGVNRKIVITGNIGKFTELSGGKATEGMIEENADFASINFVCDEFIAVGILGKVYRMDNKNNSWSLFKNSIGNINIEASCQYLGNKFLVCGWQGLIALYDKNGFVKRLNIPSTVILTSITSDQNGEILACGQNGTVVMGNMDSLKVLNFDGVKIDFWSIRKFQRNVYIASTNGLYKMIDNNTLELVKFNGDKIPKSFYHLDIFNDSLMLSVGQADAITFDGNQWTNIF